MRVFATALGFFIVLCLFLPAPSFAGDSFFDVWTEMAPSSAPPYPNVGHSGALAHMGGGVIVEDGDFSIVLTQCTRKASGYEYPTRMTGKDNGAGVGDFAVDSFFDVLYEAAADTTYPPCDICVDSFFDITFSYNGGVGGGPGALASLHSAYPPGDARRYFTDFFVDSFFDITYEVDLAPDVHHRITVHGSVPPELKITSVSVGLGSPGTADSFFDVFVEVSPILPPDPVAPVLSLHQTGIFGTSPVPVANTSWGAVKSLYR